MNVVKPFFVVFALLTLGFLLFSETPQVDATPATNKTQAVCNVSPVKNSYTEAGCKTAFNSLPPKIVCPRRNEFPQLISCTVNADACVNSAGVTGRWCTCKYTCEFR